MVPLILKCGLVARFADDTSIFFFEEGDFTIEKDELAILLIKPAGNVAIY